MCERGTWAQVFPYADRLNYVSPMLNNVGFALAVEKLCGLRVPERCQWYRMILGELGYDPRTTRSTFTAGVRRAIAQGAWWIWLEGGELRFQCNVGPKSAATAQLQGVWTPPEQRGKGYASIGLAAVANRLFDTEATLTLYVNDFNGPALALYERLNFVRVGTFATYLFP